jgi:SAM-dependent methyltransferase
MSAARGVVNVVRGGNLRARLTAVRDGQAAVRVAAVGAGLHSGVLDRLAAGSRSTSDLATDLGWPREDLLDALLRVLAALRLVRSVGERWSPTRRGRRLLRDDVLRAAYEGFADYHVGVYRDLEDQLAGGPGRRDVADKGEVIARLSRMMDPFVLGAVDRELREHTPARVLDVGCGSGSHLAHMLRSLPDATGVGVEVDAGAAALARTALAEAGLDGRARVVEGDVRALAVMPEEFDLALVANVVYYLPEPDRVPVLRAVAERVRRGGVVLVVSTTLEDSVFSRHFDLLLRAQEGAMGLPSTDLLCRALREAGLEPAPPRRIAPGEPLTAVTAVRR